jgi:hypothetical protein
MKALRYGPAGAALLVATLLPFEVSAMGWKVALGRLVLDVPGVLAIAWLTDRTVSWRKKADEPGEPRIVAASSWGATAPVGAERANAAPLSRTHERTRTMA